MGRDVRLCVRNKTASYRCGHSREDNGCHVACVLGCVSIKTPSASSPSAAGLVATSGHQAHSCTGVGGGSLLVAWRFSAAWPHCCHARSADCHMAASRRRSLPPSAAVVAPASHQAARPSQLHAPRAPRSMLAASQASLLRACRSAPLSARPRSGMCSLNQLAWFVLHWRIARWHLMSPRARTAVSCRLWQGKQVCLASCWLQAKAGQAYHLTVASTLLGTWLGRAGPPGLQSLQRTFADESFYHRAQSTDTDRSIC